METFKEWAYLVFIGCLVVAAGYGILDYLFDISGRRRQQQFDNEKLTCRRCNQLASPIGGTWNRYRCDNCGNQFVGARHSF